MVEHLEINNKNCSHFIHEIELWDMNK
jgi:hypothetical protein